MNFINETIHFLKVAFVEFKLTFSSEFSYRWQVFVWVLSDIIQPVIFTVLWSAVAGAGDSGITTSEVISYYFMVMIVSRFTQDWSIQFVSDSIIRGEFSKYLLKPNNYLSEMLGMNLAIRLMRVITLLPFVVIGYILLRDQFEYAISMENLLLFSIAVAGGFLINFFLGNTFALLAIYLKQIQGLKALFVNLSSILSGQYIPLAFLPTGLLIIFQLLPFRYILSFPIEIIMGSLSKVELERGFVLMFFWLISMVIIYKISFKLSIRKYESEGA